MTTEGTTGLNPKTIQRLRDEFKEQFSELIEANSKGWPACLEPAGGISPRKSIEISFESKPSPLYFNWTNEAIPPPPPSYQPIDKETYARTDMNCDKNTEQQQSQHDDDVDSDDDENYNDDNYFNDDEDDEEEGESKSPSSVISHGDSSHHSKRRSYPQPISQVFPQQQSSFSQKKYNQNHQYMMRNNNDDEKIAGRIVDKEARPKRTCPQIKSLIERYEKSASLNSYLKEHIADNWKVNAKSKEFREWLECHEHLWRSFASSRAEDIATVFRLYLQKPSSNCHRIYNNNKNLPKKKEAEFEQDEASKENIGTKLRHQLPHHHTTQNNNNDKDEEDSMFQDDDLTADSNFRRTDNYSNSDDDDDDDDARFGEDSSAQIRQKQQQQLARGKGDTSHLSFSNESQDGDSYSTSSQTQRSLMSEKNQIKKKVNKSKGLSFMKPTASSSRKQTKITKNRHKKGKMNTSMKPILDPVKEEEVARRSKWAKPQKLPKPSSKTSHNPEKGVRIDPSPVLVNARFADGVPRKPKSEHQRNFGWK